MKDDVPATLAESQARFDTEEACEDDLAKWRWAEGSSAPSAPATARGASLADALYECRARRHQVAVTAGTVMHRSRLPLTTWFWAIFLVARHKKGISALRSQADLGLDGYESAWLLLHRVRRAFGGSRKYLLQGRLKSTRR